MIITVSSLLLYKLFLLFFLSRKLRRGARRRARPRTSARLRDIVNARTSLIFLIHRIQPNEVLLRVRGHLRRRSRNDKISRNRSPVAFTKLGQSEKKQAMFFFRPRNTFSSLLLLRELLLGAARAGDRNVRSRRTGRFRRAAGVGRFLLLHAVAAAILLVLRRFTRRRSGHFKLNVVIQTPI